MDNSEKRRSIVEWDESDVQTWLRHIGYPQYEHQIKEHRISGDVLCMLDADSLKGVGVATVGQRLAILKAIYNIKLSEGIPLEASDWVPPSEVQGRSEGLTLDRLHRVVQEQSQRLQVLEDENAHFQVTIQTFIDEYNSWKGAAPDENGQTLRRQPSFKWAQFKPNKSPTKAEMESPHASPHRLEHDVPSITRTQPVIAVPPPPPLVVEKPKQVITNTESPNITPAAPKPFRQDSADNLKSFKVSLEDPTWKVLPAALKKYRINNDNWENYAMFICYGSPGNRIERCLSYDEKPLLLFQKLKDAKKNPVFMLKHIKDIRSPIVVAQQKHAARKANSVISNDSTTTGAATLGHAKTASKSLHRPPKLEVPELSTPSLGSGITPQPGWPEASIASPAVEAMRNDDTPNSAGVRPSHRASSSVAGTSTGALEPSRSNFSEAHPAAGRDMPVPSTGVSYAVAIYPYMAEQEDEFDVVVGDTFVILSRARGWWVVQRDPTGSGVVDTDLGKQGWVPAGCLLETSVPVASAIAEARSAAWGGSTPPDTPTAKTPILPLSIISTSFPGIALMDYKKKGDEELDLVKDDALRVFKRYNHWSYAVKEDGGDRGWVPSWFIGKVATGSGPVPPTPNTSLPPAMHHSTILSDNNESQVSPMSSAFPAPGHARPI